MSTLAFIYIRQGRYVEAEALLRESIPSEEKSLGPTDLSTLGSKRNLAFVLDNEGKFDEAEKLVRGVYTTERKSLALPTGKRCFRESPR